MTFRKVACALLLVALATPATVVRAAGDEPNPTTPTKASGILASIERAAASAASQPATPLLARAVAASSTSSAASIPLALPHRSRVSKSAGMMVVGLVGTAAGLAGTYYMVKTMKDQTKTTPGS
jgi:hypothetical protein